MAQAGHRLAALQVNPGHSKHSLASLIYFVEQRGELQQVLEGAVHVLSEVLLC